jgi:hypothetical protein
VLSNVGTTCGNCGGVMHACGYNSNVRGVVDHLKASLRIGCFRSMSKRGVPITYGFGYVPPLASMHSFFEDLHIKIL